jgi:uncharacterized membrane protein
MKEFSHAGTAQASLCSDSIIFGECWMGDTLDRPQDDAPLATSKHASAAVEAATDFLLEPRGDTLIGRAVTINRPRAELFAYWRDFANLATFMENVERIDVLDRQALALGGQGPRRARPSSGIRCHRGARGALIAWARTKAPTSQQRPHRVPRRRRRGTVVTATILYDPPAGTIGKLIAKMFQREPKPSRRGATCAASSS